MAIAIKRFPRQSAIGYGELRDELRSGDLLLCSGTGMFSRMIQAASESVWSHVIRVGMLQEPGYRHWIRSERVHRACRLRQSKGYKAPGRGEAQTMRIRRFISVRSACDTCQIMASSSFSVGTNPPAGSQHMKRAASVFSLVLGIGIPGPATAIAQADAGSDSVMVAGTVFRDCPSCPEMVIVPAGTFIMGSAESERGRLRAVYDEEGTAITWTSIDEVELPVEEGQRLVVVEGPQRYVTIESPFAVGVYEVTFDEWDACARAGGCGGVIPDNEGWGRGTPTGCQRQLGRSTGLCTVVVAGDGA